MSRRVSLPGADELFRTTGGMALQPSTPRRGPNGETRVPAPAGESDGAAGAEDAPPSVPVQGGDGEGSEHVAADAESDGEQPRSRFQHNVTIQGRTEHHRNLVDRIQAAGALLGGGQGACFLGVEAGVFDGNRRLPRKRESGAGICFCIVITGKFVERNQADDLILGDHGDA